MEPPIDSDWHTVYTKRIRLRGGRVIYAASYGLEAFCIKVRRKK